MFRCLLGLLVPGLAFASPAQLSHSGRLLDALGAPVQGPTDVTIALFPTATDGAPVFSELFDNLPVADGYYSVILGATVGTPLDTSVLTPPLWVQVSVGATALLPRQAVVQVPYAANSASSAAGGLIVDNPTTPTRCVRPQTSASSYKVSYVPVHCTTGVQLGLQTRSGAYEVGSGLNPASCHAYQALATYMDHGDGTYWIDPTGGGATTEHIVYCDMDDIANLGWTLVFSSQAVSGLADKGTNTPSASQATLTPSGSMLSTYTPFASVAAIRFSCDGGKDGTIDFADTQTSNTIYNHIKSSTTGSLHVPRVTLDSGGTIRWNPTDYDDLSDPDFLVETAWEQCGSAGAKWGTCDDWPHPGPANDDWCNGVDYVRAPDNVVSLTSTTNAYFYIWVR